MILRAATWMKLEIIILSEVSQKKTQMKLLTKHKPNHGHREQVGGCQEGGCMGKGWRGGWG